MGKAVCFVLPMLVPDVAYHHHYHYHPIIDHPHQITIHYRHYHRQCHRHYHRHEEIAKGSAEYAAMFGPIKYTRADLKRAKQAKEAPVCRRKKHSIEENNYGGLFS